MSYNLYSFSIQATTYISVFFYTSYMYLFLYELQLVQPWYLNLYKFFFLYELQRVQFFLYELQLVQFFYMSYNLYSFTIWLVQPWYLNQTDTIDTKTFTMNL